MSIIREPVVRRLLLVLVALAPACDREPPQQTEAKPAEVERTKPDRELWAATCPETMLLADPRAPKGPPPLPPPPLQPSGTVADTSPTPEPTASELPERLTKLPRPPKSEYAAGLGLKTDACDPQPLVSLLDRHADEESLYCAIAFAFEECGQLDEAMAWTKRRVTDFPESADARLALALRRFEALKADPKSGLLANPDLSHAERLAIATAVVADAEAALALRPNHQHARWIAVAGHLQKMFARPVDTKAETLADQLALLQQRKDLMAAWAHANAEGKARGLIPCNEASVSECLPAPPLSEEEQREDAAIEARLRALLDGSTPR